MKMASTHRRCTSTSSMLRRPLARGAQKCMKERTARERLTRSSSDLKCKPAGSTSWFAFVVARYDSKQPARTAFLRARMRNLVKRYTPRTIPAPRSGLRRPRRRRPRDGTAGSQLGCSKIKMNGQKTRETTVVPTTDVSSTEPLIRLHCAMPPRASPHSPGWTVHNQRDDLGLSA